MKRFLSIIAFGVIFCVCASAKFVKETEETFAHIPEPLKAAHWISIAGDGALHDVHNSYFLVRGTFNLVSLPKKAPLYITADQAYKLYINGKYICRGPARGVQKWYPYAEIDVAKYLRKGKNVLAIRVFNNGRSTFSYLHEGFFGVIFALDLGSWQFTSGVKDSVKVIAENANDRDTVPTSVQLNYQEHIDMRKLPEDWTALDFDDSKWGKSRVRRVFNAMPFYNLEARGTPMNEEFILDYPKVIAFGQGKCFSQQQRYRNINELFDKEQPSFNSADCLAKDVLIKATENGKFQSFVVDFGKTVIAMPIIEVKNAVGGEIIDMMAGESFEGTFKIRNDYLRGSHAAFSNRMICRKGNQCHEFFSPYGMRYVEVRVRNNTDSNLKISFTGKWSAYPLGNEGVFKTSDKLLNDIWNVSVNTQRACALDGYVDTPHREQAQWWGDARVQSWNTFFISGDARLLRRGIRIISQQTLPNGLTYGHAPTLAHHCILPDFSIIWLMTLWDHYWQTGTPEAFVAHRSVVDGILSYFDSATDKNTGLLKHDVRYWLFMDWCQIQKIGQPSVLNLWYLNALKKLYELCKRNGFDVDAENFKTRSERVENAICKNLLSPEGLVYEGILPNGKLNPDITIHAQTLAKMCNLKGFNFQKALDKVLLPFIRQQKTMKELGQRRTKLPSSFWVVYVLQVLDEAGYRKEVVDFYKRNWLEMVVYNGTFEGYDKSESFSHAWTAHPIFMLPRIIGGVRQTSPAWKSVSFDPSVDIVESARVEYPTIHGKIVVEIKNGKADISVPKNISISK